MASAREGLPLAGTGRGRSFSALLGTVAMAGCLAAAVRTRLLLVTVSGPSMQPAVAVGDRLLVVRGLRGRRGCIVAVTTPRAADPSSLADYPDLMVKRLLFVGGDAWPAQYRDEKTPSQLPQRSVWVQGDSAQSWDSRSWGPLPSTRIVGTVLVNFGQPAAPRLTRLRTGRWCSRTPAA